MPTSHEIKGMQTAMLIRWCRWLTEQPSSSAVASDQARSLIANAESIKGAKTPNVPHPVRNGVTLGEARAESLRRQMISLLAASL